MQQKERAGNQIVFGGTPVDGPDSGLQTGRNLLKPLSFGIASSLKNQSTTNRLTKGGDFGCKPNGLKPRTSSGNRTGTTINKSITFLRRLKILSLIAFDLIDEGGGINNLNTVKVL